MLCNDRARGISKKIRDNHKKFLGLVITYLEERNITYIDDVTPKHIRGFMILKLEEGCAESYVNSHLRSIRVLFKYCTDEEIKWMLSFAKKATFFKVKNMEKSRTGFQTTFTKQRDYLSLLLIDTGMRINEVINLRVDQLCEKEIFIEKSKNP